MSRIALISFEESEHRGKSTTLFPEAWTQKPACPVSECIKKHAKELHEFLTRRSTLVNMLECREEDDNKGCLNTVMG
jgi:hypothetical protein